ncbi:MAG: diaminopimelate decarboxylase family protein [Candidatus Heimdallarchaeota archaeon]
MTKNDTLFTRDGEIIRFDNVDLNEDILKEHGSPTYVFSERKLKENITELKTSFEKHYPKTTIAYSMKNNTLIEINSIIAEHLGYFETASRSELKLVEQLAYEKKKELNIISTGIYKSDQLIENVLDFPDFESNKISQDEITKLFAIDSYQDLLNIERISKKFKRKPKVLIRVNPGLHMNTNETIFASANISAKCASIISDTEPIITTSDDSAILLWLPRRETIPSKDTAENLVKEAHTSEYLDLVGIHCHLGSQITNLEYFDRFFEVVTKFFKLMNEEVDGKLSILDLGGGYPVAYNDWENVPSIESIAKSLATNIKNADIQPDVIIESGRFITASAGILLSQVKLTKESSTGRKIAVLDLSVYGDLLDILTAGWYFETLLVNDLPAESDESVNFDYDLVGGTNDILDRLNPRVPICSNCEVPLNKDHNRTFPRELQVGDLIIVKNTGAYTTCFNSTYSGRSFPNLVIIPENELEDK